jgi:hypothetical protein
MPHIRRNPVWFVLTFGILAPLGCSSGDPVDPGGANGPGTTGTMAGSVVAGAPAPVANAGRASTAGSGGSTSVGGPTRSAGTSGGAGTNAVTAAGGAGATAAAAGSGAGAAGSGAGGAGAAGAGGAVAAAGRGGSSAGGSGASAGGAGGSDTPPTTSACKPWPAATTMETVSATIQVSGTYDGKLKRFVGSGALGSGNQDEGQDPLFELADGATLTNVIIGAPAADGVHCKGTCKLQNVWWEDVGEDAATFMGTAASQTMTIDCAGAKKADDKVLQHNGPGTFIVRNFFVEDFGKIYRSCGNCKSQFERHVELSDIDAKGGKLLVGINENYKDSAKFKNITIHDTSKKVVICERFTGNDKGDEPTKIGDGADATHCIYADSDLHWVN